MKIAFATAFVGALAAASAVSANTVTINVQRFGSIQENNVNLVGARAAQAGFHGTTTTIVETFEKFTLTPRGGAGSPSNDPASSFTDPSIVTTVGTLTNITPDGSGTTNLNPSGQLHVRDGSGIEGSRFNTTLNGKNYLDSNDNSGILWTIPGAANLIAIDRISFLATDIDDVGKATFNIVAAGLALNTNFVLNSNPNVARKNGELLLFTLLFSHRVTDLTIALNIDPGDGFNIDDLTVAQIPLPAAAWFMLSAAGFFAATARARRRA
jgi:hypothetical protein